MDVGKEHLSTAVLLPDSNEDADDPPPDILDIFYSLFQLYALHYMLIGLLICTLAAQSHSVTFCVPSQRLNAPK